MTTMIQTAHIQNNQNSSIAADCGVLGAHLEPIDACLLSSVTGGKSFLKRFGGVLKKEGEIAAAVGAVGTVIPVVGETGIPEGVAAAGGAAWLLGSGAEALGGRH